MNFKKLLLLCGCLFFQVGKLICPPEPAHIESREDTVARESTSGQSPKYSEPSQAQQASMSSKSQEVSVSTHEVEPSTHTSSSSQGDATIDFSSKDESGSNVEQKQSEASTKKSARFAADPVSDVTTFDKDSVVDESSSSDAEGDQTYFDDEEEDQGTRETDSEISSEYDDATDDAKWWNEMNRSKSNKEAMDSIKNKATKETSYFDAFLQPFIDAVKVVQNTIRSICSIILKDSSYKLNVADKKIVNSVNEKIDNLNKNFFNNDIPVPKTDGEQLMQDLSQLVVRARKKSENARTQEDKQAAQKFKKSVNDILFTLDESSHQAIVDKAQKDYQDEITLKKELQAVNTQMDSGAISAEQAINTITDYVSKNNIDPKVYKNTMREWTPA